MIAWRSRLSSSTSRHTRERQTRGILVCLGVARRAAAARLHAVATPPLSQASSAIGSSTLSTFCRPAPQISSTASFQSIPRCQTRRSHIQAPCWLRYHLRRTLRRASTSCAHTTTRALSFTTRTTWRRYSERCATCLRSAASGIAQGSHSSKHSCRDMRRLAPQLMSLTQLTLRRDVPRALQRRPERSAAPLSAAKAGRARAVRHIPFSRSNHHTVSGMPLSTADSTRCST